MTVFYDPKEKKPQMWAFIVFVVIPVFLLIVVFIFGQQRVQQKTEEERSKAKMDVFEKF